jgi:hypothetical protein
MVVGTLSAGPMRFNALQRGPDVLKIVDLPIRIPVQDRFESLCTRPASM